MNEADQTIVEAAKDALESGKMVMVVIRGLHAMAISDIQLSSDVGLVTMTCPASDELGVGASQLFIRIKDLIGVSVFT